MVHAYSKREATLHFLCLVQTVLSVWNHGCKNKWLRRVDIFFALVLFSYGTFYLIYTGSPFTALAVVLVVLWAVECRTQSEGLQVLLHALLHGVAVLGLHSYLYLN